MRSGNAARPEIQILSNRKVEFAKARSRGKHPDIRTCHMFCRILRHGFLPVLLVLHVWLSIGGSKRVGLVYDEPVHILSGLYYNTTEDYRFQPENGVLPQRLEALPWVLAGVEPPELHGAAWEQADVWSLSTRMMDAAGDQRTMLLQQSRLVSALAGAAVIIVVYAWSLELFGFLGAAFVSILAAFCPNLIAHSGLATTDVWGVLGALLSVLAWWRLCHRLSPGRIVMAGLAAGFFAICKFSCVLLAPVALILVAVRLLCRAPLPCAWGSSAWRLAGWTRGPALIAGGLGSVLVAALVVWAAYGFRYSSAADNRGEFISPWSTMLIETPEQVGLYQLGEPLEENTVVLNRGIVQEGIAFARSHRLLPEAWLYGFAFVTRNTQSRLAYLAGEYRITGWRGYFPTALLLKTSLGGLLAIGAGLFAWCGITNKKRLVYRLAPLLILAGVLMTAAINSRINIGLRHILPVIVSLWICAGVVVLTRPGRFRLILTGLLALACVGQAASTLRIFPHALTYFNPLAGSDPDYWLVDSNLDWGQGLPELGAWLRAHPDKQPVYLSYFGTDTPARYGIKAIRFADFPFDQSELRLPAELDQGWYCFGPTQYRRVYSETRGPWTAARETLYQSSLARVLNWIRESEAGDVKETSAAQIPVLMQFDNLRFARLGFYLQGRSPDIRLPGGMMIFHLTDSDLYFAFHASLPQVAAEILRRQSTPVSVATPSR